MCGIQPNGTVLQSLFASPYEVPPVPTLGGPAGLDNMATYSPQSSASLLRQPRGPPAGSAATGHFAMRSRAPTDGSSPIPGSGGGAPVIDFDQQQQQHDGGLDAQSHTPLEI